MIANACPRYLVFGVIPSKFHTAQHNHSHSLAVTFSSKQRSFHHSPMSSGIDELIAALPRVSDQQLEAWFIVVVKTKAELNEAKRFFHGPLTRFHRSVLV